MTFLQCITRMATDLKSKFAAIVHTHAASDITSGTLGVARGGTGGTTALDARKNLSVPVDSSIAYVESTTATKNHAVGDYFMLGSVLMKATAAIATGEQITTSKATPVTIQSQIDTLRDSVFRHRGTATDTDLNSTMYYALGCWSLTNLSYTNKPSETNVRWGTLIAFVTNTNAPLSQMIIAPSDYPGRIYIRRYAGNAWASWHAIVGGLNA